MASWDLFVFEGTLCLQVDVDGQETGEEGPRVRTRNWLKRAGDKLEETSKVWRRRRVEERRKR